VVDLAPIIETAQRLIAENGRTVTFIRHDETLSDPTQPWLGPADARATPNTTSVHSALFVEPDSTQALGLAQAQSDLLMDSEQIMVVAQGEVDLSTFQEVLDEGVYWKITEIQTLRPGTTTVLSFVGVKR
jgi:hypothetical protein